MDLHQSIYKQSYDQIILVIFYSIDYNLFRYIFYHFFRYLEYNLELDDHW